jgi:hypothetical protein
MFVSDLYQAFMQESRVSRNGCEEEKVGSYLYVNR